VGDLVVGEHRFRAMGTDVQVLVTAPDPQRAAELAAGAEADVRRYEARWSRFLASSELSRLNASAGGPVLLPRDTFALVELAVSAWRQTDGLFDPTVLDALEAAGYDRSFEDVTGRELGGRAPGRVPGPGGIRLDGRLGEVVVPAGVHLDLGGIGKGHTADLVAVALVERGAAGALVNLGGDLRALGAPIGGDVWVVAVDTEPAVEVALAAGAVATSTTAKRRWTSQGHPMHHLIDPATGAPAETGLATVTVVAGTAAWAEVLAKAVLVGGLARGAGLLSRFGVTGLAVADDGTVTRFDGFDAYEVRR